MELLFFFSEQLNKNESVSPLLAIETNDIKRKAYLEDKVDLHEENKTFGTTEKNPKMSTIKKYEIHNSKEKVKNQRNCCHLFISTFIILFISILIGKYYVFTNNSNEDFSLVKLQIELEENILNQNSSIHIIIESLKKLRDTSFTNILTVLEGPTGVGKTHLVNILNKHIGPYLMKVFDRSDLPDLCIRENPVSCELRKQLYFNNFFVVVLDDLNFNDIENLKKFIAMTFSIEETNILIITIFHKETKDCIGNSYEPIDENSIVEKLGSMCENFYYNSFNYLNETHVESWLRKSLLSENYMYKFDDAKVLLRKHDIKCNGLKGLHSKLNLIREFVQQNS